MSKKQQIIQTINNGIITKLVPSSIIGAGVGVQTLTEIHKGEVVFAPRDNCFVQWGELADQSGAVIEYVKKVCNHNFYGFWIDCDINEIGAAYFVNHSDSPNLMHNRDTDVYYALKNIEIGEELTCKYLSDEIDWV
jgi:SET domain-containing protein